ncbi:RNA ligase [Saccharopolyspora pogona]|uniref:RNA ligase n=1 Tax=Saccharopolyspora pogona TaxID=333966 RepID=UPI001685CA1B|nr:RNA ligase [Saccharopolyspora pogona]
MKLHDLLNPIELADMIEQKFVRVQRHPDYPLSIYNYTDKAMVFNVWNDVTKACRGLIANDEGDIVARPFPKFFNYGQAESKTYRETEPVLVTDKVDGSLGILYPTPDGGWAIATRGSFASGQARHATQLLNEKYTHLFKEFNTLETWLFEIVYPDNRIVVDYCGLNDLVFLGAMNIEEGVIIPIDIFSEYDWDGPRTEMFGFRSLAEALAAEPRPGKEGLVVNFLKSNTMVKIKQEDYLKLHKIVTGLNEHVVWEHIQKEWIIHDLLETLPDEFHEWATKTAKRMFVEFNEIEGEVERHWDAAQFAGLLGDRKEFALAIKDKAPWLKASLFAMLDGKDYWRIIWKQIEPKKDAFVR